ncbi:MAG: DUF2232 domain-containing protein [Tissierellia bacterium]|nr:DUF2232 domain-containing protein [Tissierellia bacterium]
MTENFNKHSIKELILAAFTAILIYYTSVSIFPFAIFVFPTPFVVLGVKRGYQHSILSLILSSGAIYLLDGWAGTIMMLVYAIIVSIPMIIALKKGFKAFKTMVIVTACVCILVVGLSVIMSVTEGIDIVKGFEDAVSTSIEAQIQIINKMNIPQTGDLKDMMRSSVTLMMAIIPSLLFIMAMSISMFNYYLSTTVLRRIGFGIIDVPKFYNFKLPSDILKGVVICIVGIFIFDKMGFGYTTELSLNIMMAFSFLFMLQGLAVAIFYLRKKMNPIVLNIFIVVTIIFNIRMFYIFIGLFDSIFNFRYRKRRE